MTEQTPEHQTTKDKILVVLIVIMIIMATFGAAFGYYVFLG